MNIYLVKVVSHILAPLYTAGAPQFYFALDTTIIYSGQKLQYFKPYLEPMPFGGTQEYKVWKVGECTQKKTLSLLDFPKICELLKDVKYPDD